MQLDTVTLMFANALTTGFACLCLILGWYRLKHPASIAWWMMAHGLIALAISLFLVGHTTSLQMAFFVATGLMTAAPGMIWMGCERFRGHKPPWYLVFAGTLVWLVVAIVPTGHDHRWWSGILPLLAFPVFMFMATVSLWMGREEKLPGRWPLMVMFSIHGLVFTLGAAELISGPSSFNTLPMIGTWFGVIHFEGIFYALGTSLLMLMICKERIEHGLEIAANMDSLTGACNRKFLFEDATRILRRCQKSGQPLSMVMFDLDYFKNINDMHGHQVGDRILNAFAETVRLSLRPRDLFGRYGGEEFIVVLPETSADTAYIVAERVRKAFADSNRFLDGMPLGATVSAGVAPAADGCCLDDVVKWADHAMYIAKHNGRNRVEMAGDLPEVPGHPDIVTQIA